MIKNLKPYLVEFEENKSMKKKNIWIITKRDKRCFIIKITYNKYTFFANNLNKRDIFLI